jgi:hypothetical protein
MSMWGHVEDRLAPFCEGSLSEREARAVAAHLSRCRRCEGLRREVERALLLVASLPIEPLPVARAAEIRAQLAHARIGGATGGLSRRRGAAFAVAAVLAVAAAGAWLLTHSTPPAVQLEPGDQLSAFERAAVALQRQSAAGSLTLDLSSSDPLAVRRWIEEQTGLGANLALERPGEDAGRFELLGAKQTTVGAASAVAVAYRIDGAAAVLLTADEAAIADRPEAWKRAGKIVRHASDPLTRAKVLTWTSSGQVYTLVSVLPGLGLESCHICHTDAKRRRLIREISS